MLISHRYRFIYLKTIKTAGSSVEAVLERFCVPEGHPEIATSTPTIETEAGVVGARGRFAEDAKWRNHMRAFEIKDAVPAEVWDGYYKFCNIRNPWDKTVSWFHFQNPGMKKLPQGEMIAAFRKWVLDTHSIGMDQTVYSIDGTSVVDDVIRYDRLGEDLTKILNRLGLEGAGEIPFLKSAERGKKKVPYQRYYDAKSRNRIANRYQAAINEFNWSFK